MKKIITLSILVLVLIGAGFAFKTPTQKKLPPVEVKGKNVVGVPFTMSATTNASGIITVTYSNPYPVIPNIQANIVNQASTSRQLLRIYSSTTSGFTCSVYQQQSVIPALLGIEILLASTSPVASADVDFLITSKT